MEQAARAQQRCAKRSHCSRRVDSSSDLYLYSVPHSVPRITSNKYRLHQLRCEHCLLLAHRLYNHSDAHDVAVVTQGLMVLILQVAMEMYVENTKTATPNKMIAISAALLALLASGRSLR